MRDDEDQARRKPPSHEVGQNLDALSVEDLGARVALLRQEIERLEAVRTAKIAALGAADAVFKR